MTTLAERREYFPQLMDNAFSLSSGGMGIHLHAVRALGKGQELPDWAKGSLDTSSSNYTATPYVFDWAPRPDTDDGFREEPYSRSPLSDLHIKLLHETYDEYHRLKRTQLRLFLGGEEALSVSDPAAPITEAAEFTSLLSRAQKQGLIEGDPNTFDQVEITDVDFSFAMNLMKQGFKLADGFFPTLSEIKFSERFKPAILKASVHKLGAMLGVTDQLAYDASAMGIPFPPTYRPDDPDGKWEANWQRLFGEPIPTLEGLYKQAHGVLVEYADPLDPLVTHLFGLHTLPYLDEKTDSSKKTPEEDFEERRKHYLQQINEGPHSADYSEEQKRIRSLGETYNNFFMRIPLPSGKQRFGINPEDVLKTDQVMTEMRVDREEVYRVLERQRAYASFDNPSFIDFDRIMRPVLLQLVRKHGYSMTDLVA